MKSLWRLSEYTNKNKQEGLNGELLLRILNVLSKTFSYEYCIITDFDGGLDLDCSERNLISGLISRDNRPVKPHIFTSEQIEKVIKRILVIDWGNFYFFSSQPKLDDKKFYSSSLHEIISDTVFTITAFDSWLIQLFTPENINIINFDFMELYRTVHSDLKNLE